ncbi:MAG TPA: acyl-CoA dehydrogenase family protein [Mycobacteriales bacterium]|jgi:alkylation response protein AidB-like acyl-CoA dehydrogenase|nr:acyl-CoA dehydrogenase family protein [Mycobacteriales bacterium]
MPRFVQDLAPLPDLYAGDAMLRAHLDRLLGEVGHKNAAPLLESLAADAAGPLRAAHLDAERHPPVHVPYDGWGRRVDRIETGQGWETQRRAAARHGLVALPYEPEARATWGAGARVVQHALLHLYGPWSATFSCPVAMSDGAATVLLADGVDPALRDRLLPRLLARDPDEAWTSGQWMTESEGGSDVGRATTAARADADGTWRLHGEKWFCSATTAEFAVALARPDGAPGGSRGLACFVVPRYAAGTRDTAPGLFVHRLKDKLGTRALPSAEVRLDGAEAWPVGDPAEPGLRRMLALVQVTRLHNAAAAAAAMRRGLLLARSYAETREAFGLRLFRQPLHREVLAWLGVDADAAFALTGLCFELLGRAEVERDEGAAALLRFAATLAKASTGKLAVAAASEVVECFGGPGYIEDTEIPRLLRDAQVLPVWEGTTNVLSLDVLRALARDDALTPYLARVDAALDACAGEWLGPVAERLRTVRDEVAEAARAAAAAPTADATQARARALMERMAHLLAAAALTEQAAFDLDRGDARTALVASLWTRRRLLGDPAAGEGHRAFAHVVDGASL